MSAERRVDLHLDEGVEDLPSPWFSLSVGVLLYQATFVYLLVNYPHYSRLDYLWYMVAGLLVLAIALLVFYALQLPPGIGPATANALIVCLFVVGSLDRISHALLASPYESRLGLRDYDMYMVFYNQWRLLSSSFQIGVLLWVAVRIRRHLRQQAEQQGPSAFGRLTTVEEPPPEKPGDRDSPSDSETAETTTSIPSQENEGPFGRVTREIASRAEGAQFLARLTILLMVVLVLVGGGASVGMWMSSHLERLRSIELERGRLLELADRLSQLEAAAGESGVEATAENLEALNEFVRGYYNSGEDYGALLKEIESSAQTSWPDIAIRATVAILTLFLVQIFFSMHRYNSQLSASLAGRAEALRIVSVDEEHRKALGTALVETLKEPLPDFGGRTASNPTEEVVRVVEKLYRGKTSE